MHDERETAKAAALGALTGVLLTLVGWMILTPKYLSYNGSELVGANSDYAGQVAAPVENRGRFSFRYPPLVPFAIAGAVRLASLLGLPVGWVWAALNLISAGCNAALIAAMIPPCGISLTRRMVGAVAWALNPLAFWFTTYVSPEIVFLPLFLCSVWLSRRADLFSGRLGLVAASFTGVTAGLAMLTRPIAVGLPIVLGLSFLQGSVKAGRREALRKFGLVALLAFLVVAPWEVWIWNRTGRWLPLSSGGPMSTLDGPTYASNSEAGRVPIPSTAASRRVQGWFLDHRKEFSKGRPLVSGIADRLFEDPYGCLSLLAEKAGWAWFATDEGARNRHVLALQIPIVGVLIASSMAAARASSAAGRFAVAAWLILLYTYGMTIVVLSITRYMVPGMAPLFALTGFLIPRSRKEAMV
jgi:hypothetical protein